MLQPGRHASPWHPILPARFYFGALPRSTSAHTTNSLCSLTTNKRSYPWNTRSIATPRNNPTSGNLSGGCAAIEASTASRLNLAAATPSRFYALTLKTCRSFGIVTCAKKKAETQEKVQAMPDDLLLYSKERESCWLKNAISILSAGEWPATKLIAELAFLCEISLSTSKRYLLKFSAPSGPLSLSSGVVSLKEKEF